MSYLAGQILPDGLGAKLGLSEVTVSRIRLLENYDLTRITDNLIDKGPQYSAEQIWPLKLHFGRADLDLARTLEREFKRFIALSLMRPRAVYAPPGPVDMYWHFFVLHTRQYDEFCDAIWGKEALEAPYPESVRQQYTRESHAPTGLAVTDLVPESIVRTLPDQTVARLEVLANYDLSYYTHHLVDEGRLFAPEQKYPIIAHFGKCDLEITSRLEFEFRRFVALTLIDGTAVFAPPGAIDMYWHFLILHTKDYRRFCDDIWGSFQHHPRGSRETESSASRATPVAS